MIKSIALTFAAALSLAPIGAGAAETAVVGGGNAGLPASPGPNAGVTALPDQAGARQARVPRPVQAPPAASRNKNDCIKTICANSNGAGG